MIPQAGATTREHAHERQDANVRATSWVLAGFFALTFVILGLLVWVIGYLSHGKPAFLSNFGAPTPALPMAEPPPLPRLETTPRGDYTAWHAAQRQILDGYGLNADGSAHIPVAKAMEALAKKGLPARPAGEERK